MGLTSLQALWLLPPVLPICLYVAFTDMREMRITNQAVLALAVVFLLLAPWVMPLSDFGLRLAQGLGVLVLGIVLNAGGALGAGDAKFAAAAAPFIAPADAPLVLVLFSAVMLAAFAAHRLARLSPLRRLAPHWKSWDMGKKFPMGLALGGTLAAYLALGLTAGA